MELLVKQGAVEISFGADLLLRYRFEDVPYKPYIDWFARAGVNIIRDAPHDHLHHHGLMFAIKVDGKNFWEEGTAPGRQRHRSLKCGTSQKDGDVSTISFTHGLDWLDPDNDSLLLQESRVITVVHLSQGDVSLLTWTSTFTVPPDKDEATLTGSHYHGLGMRFVESMDKVGEFRNADHAEGELVRGVEYLTRSRWCAYGAPADGQPMTVAMFDATDNPRYPAHWFTMKTPFAYLSATRNLYREPMVLEKGKEYRFRHGVALWQGTPTDEEVESVYQRWLEVEP